jgi:hypothetical protein
LRWDELRRVLIYLTPIALGPTSTDLSTKRKPQKLTLSSATLTHIVTTDVGSVGTGYPKVALQTNPKQLVSRDDEIGFMRHA